MDINQVAATLEKDNPTAAHVLNEYIVGATQQQERIGTLERDLKGSAEKRDQLKNIVRQATGLEEITADGLSEFLTKGDSQVETYKNEIGSLQDKLASSANAVDEVSKQYEAKIFDLSLDRVATMMGVSNEVHNSHAYGVVFDALKNNATTDHESGEIISIRTLMVQLFTTRRVNQRMLKVCMKHYVQMITTVTFSKSNT